ncbi:transcription elongation factor A N-terminal and central domain-containing protein 2-like isoform X2 [Physella acuta]|uniref:transcription elongation factor A N-terminal and central domain-containing protein 2-like isoform X2 n=1 Tax=Physella acuta TaxID=109671 RepID=UPI0027DB9AD7|nr:transcription elongation factor A N-terminal and central domain-containing protein 2-like isoform X2 [Physella acuta]
MSVHFLADVVEQRVVVVEDIERLKSKLQLPNQKKTVLLDSLKELGKKIPPRNVMVTTKIGRTVSKLKKHPDSDVSNQAKEVYKKWSNYFEQQTEKPQIEVRCDQKSEAMRQQGKTRLAEALHVESDHPMVEAIERETFYQNSRLNSASYRGTLRTLYFKLKHNEDLRNSVISGSISVEDFVKEHKKSKR